MKKKTQSLYRTALLPATEIMIGISVSVLSFIMFLMLAKNISSIHQIDVFMSMVVYELRTPMLTTLMLAITSLGNELLLIFLVAILLISIIRKRKREALMVILVFISGVFLNLVLKDIIGRARPDMSPLIVEPLYSFPSGHAMNAFVFYSTLILYVHRVSHNITITLVSVVINCSIILLVGISRVYLGVHYVSDVLAGFIAGFCWIAIALSVEKTLQLLWRRRQIAT